MESHKDIHNNNVSKDRVLLNKIIITINDYIKNNHQKIRDINSHNHFNKGFVDIRQAQDVHKFFQTYFTYIFLYQLATDIYNYSEIKIPKFEIAHNLANQVYLPLLTGQTNNEILQTKFPELINNLKSTLYIYFPTKNDKGSKIGEYLKKFFYIKKSQLKSSIEDILNNSNIVNVPAPIFTLNQAINELAIISDPNKQSFDFFQILPKELIYAILSFVDLRTSQKAVKSTCKFFNNACKEKLFWKLAIQKRFPQYDDINIKSNFTDKKISYKNAYRMLSIQAHYPQENFWSIQTHYLNNTLDSYYNAKIYLAVKVPKTLSNLYQDNLSAFLNMSLNNKNKIYAILNNNRTSRFFPVYFSNSRQVCEKILDTHDLYVLTLELPNQLANDALKKFIISQLDDDNIDLRQYITEITRVVSSQNTIEGKINLVASVSFVNDGFVLNNKDTQASIDDKISQLKEENDSVDLNKRL